MQRPRRQIIFFVFACCFFVSFAPAEESKSARSVLVRYKDGGRAPMHNRMMRTFGVRPAKTLQQIGFDLVPVPAGETVETFLEKLRADPNVLSAEPNRVVRAFFTPNDGQFNNQYYLGPNFANLEAAWEITQGDSDTVIAVLDTGIALTHTDLVDKLWEDPNNSGVHGATMQIDWNGDGDCDDPNPTGDGPEMCADTTPDDDNTGSFHGTRVAGIAAAETNNTSDVAGVCPNCQIMAVKVLNAAGFGTEEAIVSGILYAVDNGAHVINLSLGSAFPSTAEQTAIDYAIDRNVTVVAASGNCDQCAPCTINYPAAFPNVISVGATNSADQVPIDGDIDEDFACHIGPLDLVAPGVDMWTLSETPGTTTGTGDGTSFAAPIVAGLAGLMKSLNPALTPAQINRYINFTADDLGPSGYDATFGFGRVDAHAALLAVQNNTPYVSNPGFPGKTFPEPNPFRPLAGEPVKIRVHAGVATLSGIKVTLLSMSGKKIREFYCNGECEWDGKNDAGTYVASGIYYYRVETPLGETEGKITVIK